MSQARRGSGLPVAKGTRTGVGESPKKNVQYYSTNGKKRRTVRDRQQKESCAVEDIGAKSVGFQEDVRGKGSLFISRRF